MIRGIRGQPYIDLDPYLDIERLQSMHESICAGLAKSERIVGSYGDGVEKSQGILDMFEAEVQYKALPPDHPVKRHGNLLQHDKNALRYYLKLVWGVYSPNTSVYLRSTMGHHTKILAEACQWTRNVDHFPELLRFIHELLFESLGRIVFFIHEQYCPIATHADIRSDRRHNPHLNDFIWMRTRLDKSFFLYDTETGAKHPVHGYSAFFNDHDFHGGDPTPTTTFSIRVDGIFNQSFRKALGVDELTSY